MNWFTEGHGFFGSLGGGRYARNLQTTFRLGCNLIILDVKNGQWDRPGVGEDDATTIDVWWWDNLTGELMLLLAYLMATRGALAGREDPPVVVRQGRAVVRAAARRAP